MPDPSIMGTEERACRALFDPIRRVSEGRMMEYYMKIREVVALLEADGWQLVQTRPLNSVLKQAGLKKR
jgi:uncharacterized membrane protein